MGKNDKKYYVVWKGFEPGVYSSWSECKAQIEGFPGASYKAFGDLEMAEKAYREGPANYVGKDLRKIRPSQAELDKVGKPLLESISVDAACSGNPGIMEYRGVDTKTGIELFHKGPYPQSTVNIGEFLAIVHALAMLKKSGSSTPIYSDSRTAIKWVKDKKAKTKLERTADNERQFELIGRAENWLRENNYPNKIMKWETAYWGEIPADFGRK